MVPTTDLDHLRSSVRNTLMLTNISHSDFARKANIRVSKFNEFMGGEPLSYPSVLKVRKCLRSLDTQTLPLPVTFKTTTETVEKEEMTALPGAYDYDLADHGFFLTDKERAALTTGIMNIHYNIFSFDEKMAVLKKLKLI